MTKSIFTLLSPLIAAAAFSASAVLAAGNPADSPGLQTTRPPGYKPIAGDAKLGAQLWKDTKLSSNGMACATCHANHGAFQASFAQPYPHTVQMAKNQLGRQTVHLDEMIQACMLMPMQAQALPWDSKELAALVAYVQIQQKSFKLSATSTQ